MKYFIRKLAYTIIIISMCCLADAEPLIIVNSSVSFSSLSKETVNLVFLGKKQKWDDGQKIYVAVLKEGETHDTFLSTYINKTASKFSSFWKMAIVSGTGYPPKFFNTEADLIQYVAEKKGAIGYISTDTPHDDVKVLVIE